MVVRDERALHEPRLVGRARHHRQRIRRHDPFEVRRDVEALDRQNELVFQMVVHRDVRLEPRPDTTDPDPRPRRRSTPNRNTSA